MPTYSYPGVYIQEVPGGPGPITGSSPSTCAVIGFTLEGVTETPTLVTSFTEFAAKFGGTTPLSSTPTAAMAYFVNGGQLLRVVRVVGAGAVKAAATIPEVADTLPETLVPDSAPDGILTTLVFTADPLSELPVEASSLSILVVAGVSTVVRFTDVGGTGTLAGFDAGDAPVGGSSGTVDYVTGELTLTFPGGDECQAGATFFATAYNRTNITQTMLWEGAAGNLYQTKLTGDPNFADLSTASFSRYVLEILKYDTQTELYIGQESFEGLVLSDATSDDFIKTVVNDEGAGSDILTLTTYPDTSNPDNLNGVAQTGEDILPSITPAMDGVEKQFAFATASRIAATTFSGVVDLAYVSPLGSLLAPIIGAPGAVGASSGDVAFTEATASLTAISPEADLTEANSVALVATQSCTAVYARTPAAPAATAIPNAGPGALAVYVGQILVTDFAPGISMTPDSLAFTLNYSRDLTGTALAVALAPAVGPGGAAPYVGTCTLTTQAGPEGGLINGLSVTFTLNYELGGPTTETFTCDAGGVLTGSATGTGTLDLATGAITALTTGTNADAAPVTMSALVYEQAIAEPFTTMGGNAVGSISGAAGVVDEANGTIPVLTTTLLVSTAAVTVTAVTYTQAAVDFNQNFVTTWTNAVPAVPSITAVDDTGATFPNINNASVRISTMGNGAGVQALTDGGAVTNYSLTCRLEAALALEADATLALTVDTMTLQTGVNFGSPLTVEDDGLGALQVSASSDPLCPYTLNPNGINTIDYDAQTLNCMFKFIADSSLGPIPLVSNDFTCAYFAQPVSSAITTTMTGGDDGAATTRSDISAPALSASSEGLYALNKIEDLLQVVIPDFETDATVSKDLIDYVDGRKDRFAIVSVPEGFDYNEAVQYKQNTLNKNSNRAAIYYPHVTIIDPVTQKQVNFPAGSMAAGIYARTDETRNVSKAPAGTVDGALRMATGVELEMTPAQAGVVNLAHVNSIVNFPFTGLAIWGARTLEAGGEFPYIQMRRLFMFVEKAVFDSTQVFVFESNSAGLRAQVGSLVSAFLLELFNSGHFSGSTPAQAFFVVCDESNNTPTTIAKGLLYVDVGLAPTRPAEFIVFRFQQKTLEG